MIVYGYVKSVKYTSDKGLFVQVRIPNVHGANDRSDYQGAVIHNYVEDKDLPYYPAILRELLPIENQVVALMSTDRSNNSFVVLGPVSN